MSNIGFEPVWVSSTTKNLTSWAKPTLPLLINLYVTNLWNRESAHKISFQGTYLIMPLIYAYFLISLEDFASVS
jgi:hypothetical protein